MMHFLFTVFSSTCFGQ